METQQIIQLNGMPINIRRTNRKKTIAVSVKQQDICVSVPMHTSLAHIEALIHKKTKWIQQKLLQQESHTPAISHQYVDGETFLYMGTERTLKCVVGSKSGIELSDDAITLFSYKPLSSVTIKNRLTKWYRAQAQLYLAQRTHYYAQLMGVKPKLINTRTYKARWGCCSTSREITYNWQIIMAPEHIMDYLIVHELCHIKEHNHSSSFWTHVEAIVPDYKDKKRWLDQNGYQFQL